MDPLESPHSPSTPGRVDPAQHELQTLRLTFQITLAALVILSGSLGVYLFRQVSALRRQTEATGRQAQQVGQYYNSTIAPQAQNFEKSVQEYAKSDAVFQARIARYFGSPDTNLPPPSPNPLGDGTPKPVPPIPATPNP